MFESCYREHVFHWHLCTLKTSSLRRASLKGLSCRNFSADSQLISFRRTAFHHFFKKLPSHVRNREKGNDFRQNPIGPVWPSRLILSGRGSVFSRLIHSPPSLCLVKEQHLGFFFTNLHSAFVFIRREIVSRHLEMRESPLALPQFPHIRFQAAKLGRMSRRLANYSSIKNKCLRGSSTLKTSFWRKLALCIKHTPSICCFATKIENKYQ